MNTSLKGHLSMLGANSMWGLMSPITKLLVSDKNSRLPKKIGLIPFAGVSPFWLF